jgi:hypothetical protein
MFVENCDDWRSPRLAKKVSALWRLARAPGLDRHRRGRVLGRPFDQLVAKGHVDQHVAFRVTAPDDLHLLENERPALAENHIALRELLLEFDRAILVAGERDVRRLFGETERAGNAAFFWRREVARNPLNHRVVEPIDGQFVVRRQKLERRRLAEDQVRVGRLGVRGRYRGNIIKDFDILKGIITNRGSMFISNY